MDRRVLKTRMAVYNGLAKALDSVSYTDMTIEDILKASNISRSTFYAHFQSKEDVLKMMSKSIFEHVLSHELDGEKDHDFSKADIFEYTHMITHCLYHLREDRDFIKRIICSECRDQFLSGLREQILPVNLRAVKLNFVHKLDIPEELQAAQLTENALITIEYWVKNDFKEEPETITNYIFAR